MAFPFFLDLERDSFDCLDGEDSFAIGEGGWVGYLARDATTPDVVTDGEAIIFDGKESSDLSRGELGWLGNVSGEVV